MRLVNGLVFRNGALACGDVFTDGERIGARDCGGETLDAAGLVVSPGFIDIHIHGAAGADLCDARAESNETVARYLASVGVTSYLGTTMALPENAMIAALTAARESMERPCTGGAVMRGINLEGPFLSPKKKGAMDEKNLRLPDIALFDRLNEASGGRIRILDVAPELPQAMELIAHAQKICTVSLAHTACNYDTARAAFKAGAAHVTHLFNAMTPFSHRAPGPVGAAADCAKTVELISDGVHVHASAVRLAFTLFGPNRVCLISDAMSACGMEDGEYALGGQKVFVQDGRAELADGTIAGSAVPLSECFRRAVTDFDVPLEEALLSVTENPARAAGLIGAVGRIEPGRCADFTLLDAKTLKVMHCVLGGKLLF